MEQFTWISGCGSASWYGTTNGGESHLWVGVLQRCIPACIQWCPIFCSWQFNSSSGWVATKDSWESVVWADDGTWICWICAKSSLAKGLSLWLSNKGCSWPKKHAPDSQGMMEWSVQMTKMSQFLHLLGLKLSKATFYSRSCTFKECLYCNVYTCNITLERWLIVVTLGLP